MPTTSSMEQNKEKITQDKGEMVMNEKIFKMLGHVGTCDITIGIVMIVTGVTIGILSIINGARALKGKRQIMI